MFSFGVDSSQIAKKAPPSSSTSANTDDDTQKRNTDCIYFLASPLTCKKGSDCDYRHSEAARMNPRDCRFWLSGNCLNARCSFRHPPLEGRTVSTSTSSLVTPLPSQAAGTVSTLNKAKTPCYFFSQGYCAKNDKCPFMHGSTTEAAPPQKAAIEPVGNAEAANGQARIRSQGAPLIEGHLIAQPTALRAQPTAIPLQVVVENPNDVQRARVPERFLNSAPSKQQPMVQNNMPENSRQSQLVKRKMEQPVQSLYVRKMEHPMKEQGEVQRLMQTQMQANKNGVALGSSLTVDERREPVYASRSASQESTKQLDNSLKSNGQEAMDSRGEVWSVSSDQEVDGTDHHGSMKSFNGITGAKRYSNGEDLRDQLVKRRKNNTGIPSSVGQSGMHGGGRLSHRKQGREMYRGQGPSSQPDSQDAVKKVMGVSLSGAGTGLRPVQSKSSAHKRPEKDQPDTMFKASEREHHISERLTASEKRVHVSSSTSVQNNNGISAFAGPKSLAQIKAEKLARAAPVSKAAQASPKPADRNPTGINNISAMAKGDVLKAKTVMVSAEFEGPKPLSFLLKEKKKLEADDSSAEETTPGPRKLELPLVKSFEELEEGEVAEDEESRSAGLDGIFSCAGASSTAAPEQEEPLVTSQQKDVDKKQGLEQMERSSDVEAADDDLQMSEDELLEMEEDAYDGEDLDVMEEDEDDDEAEFARKLGSFFAMST